MAKVNKGKKMKKTLCVYMRRQKGASRDQARAMCRRYK